MSTNFGTTSLPTVFKPTGATPIDVRTYFESYASALEAARIAAVAGDSNVIYYFGQLLTVYEPTTGAATIYKIVKAPEGTTYTDAEGVEQVATGALEAIDTTFEVGDIPVATASSIGAVKVAATSDIALSADGSIDLNATVKAEIAKIADKQDNLVIADGYDAETNPVATKQTVTDAVSKITGFEYSVVAELPETGVKGTIYLVASKTEEGKDEYLEYVWIEVDGDGSFERLGRTIDMEAELAGYATEQWVQNQSYQTTVQATADKQALEAKDTELNTAIEDVASDLVALSNEVDKKATQTQVNEINNTVETYGTRLDTVEQLASTTSSDLASAKADLEAKDIELSNSIETITTETIPAVEQSVTDLGTRVTSVESTAASNLASAKSELEDKIAEVQSAADDAATAVSDEALRAANVEADLQSQITAVKTTADAAAKQIDLTTLSGTVSEHTTKLGDIDDQIVTISGDIANIGKNATDALTNAATAQTTANANKPVAGIGISVTPITENGGQTVAIDSTVVATLSDVQTITGAKTFSTPITLPASNEGAQNAITRAEAKALAESAAASVEVSGSDYIDVAEGNIISVKSTVATTDKAQTFAETVTFSKPIEGSITGNAAGLDGLTTSINDLNRLIDIEDAANAKQDPISVSEGLTFESNVVGIDDTVVPMLSGTEVKVGSTVLASTADVDNKITAKISASATADWTSDEKVPTLKAVADKITAVHAGVMSYKGVITVNAESTAETVAVDIAAKAPIVEGDFFIINASGDVNVTVDGSVLSSNDLIIASEAMETVDLTKFQLVGINDATVVNTTSEQEIKGLKKFATGVQVLVGDSYESVVTQSVLESAIDEIPVADSTTIQVTADNKLTVVDADKIVKATSISSNTITLTGKDIVVDTPDETETTLVANVAYVNTKVDAVTPVAGTGITIGADKSISVDATVLTTTSSHTDSSNGPIAGNLDFTGTLQKLPTVEESSTYSVIATIADIDALIRAAAPTTKKTYVSGINGNFSAQTDGKTSIWEITPVADDNTLDTADVTCTVRDNNGELVHPEIKFGEKKLTITANTAALEGILPLSVTVIA